MSEQLCYRIVPVIGNYCCFDIRAGRTLELGVTGVEGKPLPGGAAEAVVRAFRKCNGRQGRQQQQQQGGR